jgi:hypothetical protein
MLPPHTNCCITSAAEKAVSNETKIIVMQRHILTSMAFLGQYFYLM